MSTLRSRRALQVPRGLDARSLARRALERVRRDGAYANLTLVALFDEYSQTPRVERALATELTYGVLRYQRLLDVRLEASAVRGLARVKPDVLDALRLAAYQILYLDRVPTHAAVNDAVGMIRARRGAKVAGFANALLRALAKKGRPDEVFSESWQTLAVAYSLPDELAQLFVDQLGLDQARLFSASLLRPAPFSVRINATCGGIDTVRQRLIRENIGVDSGRYSPVGLTLHRLDDPFASESYRKGNWTVQDESAQLVSTLVAPGVGESVLDACAGVGGKSTHLAEMMSCSHPTGSEYLLCTDISTRKLDKLRQHAERLGLSCRTQVVDFTRPAGSPDIRFDAILVDPPCTGLGVLRRHPELKWRWSPEKLSRMVELQRTILDHVVSVLRPGGRLIYSVCTTTEAEGPAQIRSLLKRHPGLTLDMIHPTDTVPADMIEEGFLRIWPHRHGCDGFFAARMFLNESATRS